MKKINIHIGTVRKCAEHGTLGSLPCAWPKCDNGVDVSEFEETVYFEGSNPRQWTRRRWESSLDGPYYSWENSDVPNWFQVRQTFWNEARRLGLIETSHPTHVYHYTSLEGFIGIVQSRSIWMTDFAYLNDRREVRYGLDLIKNTVSEIQECTTRDDVHDLLAAWIERLVRPNNRICITAFSGEDDSLSQWRAYGPIAIGFPVRHLALHVDQSQLQAVEYDAIVQEKLIRTYVNHLIAAFQVDRDGNRLNRIPDIYHKSANLLELAVFFKDPAFRSENEYRLAFIDHPDVFRSLGMESPPKSFRSARGRIIPFVPSTEIMRSSERNFPLEFSNVVLGPESDELLEQGVREFLSEHGHSGVEVRRSTVPFRT